MALCCRDNVYGFDTVNYSVQDQQNGICCQDSKWKHFTEVMPKLE